MLKTRVIPCLDVKDGPALPAVQRGQAYFKVLPAAQRGQANKQSRPNADAGRVTYA